MIKDKIIKEIKDYLSYQSSVSSFIEKFESLFYDSQDELLKEIDENYFNLLDEIYMSVNYFEPNELIRKESKNYLSEEQIRSMLNEKIGKLT